MKWVLSKTLSPFFFQLIGEKYRKWKKGREEKNSTPNKTNTRTFSGTGSAGKDSDAEPPAK